MKQITIIIFLFIVIPSYSCTNIIVTKGASVDGSVFMAYTNDAEYIYHLYDQPSRDYKAGEMMEFRSSRNGVSGTIPQVEHTYALIGFHMNEHQVSIGVTTFTGREELWNHSKYLEYWHLMRLALERSKTAREAVNVITHLAHTYGYGSEGESFSITDTEEAWILEMIGTGDGGEGAIWVAMKIPDGMISCHANKARIGAFPLDDPENCLYSGNVISFAIERGYYDPDSGEPFEFNEVYCPSTPSNLRYCSSRVWSILNRAAPSLNLSIDYNRAVAGAERYPLWVKPDKKLGVSDIINLLRDHYEDTEIDMTKGFDAGPFGNPNRNRPLTWEIDSVECAWERPVSTYNTSFSFIAQSRGWLPDEIGGLIWFGVDDTYFTCYLESSSPSELNIEPVFPHGKEKFMQNSIQKIQWYSSVPSQNNSTVSLELSTTGDEGPWTLIADELPNNGNYQWQVNPVSSTNCFIRYTVSTGAETSTAITANAFTISDGSTGIIKQAGKSEFNCEIYPTPFKENIFIRCENNFDNPQNLRFSLFNTIGKTCFYKREKLSKGINIIKINIPEHFQSGLYFYTIEMGTYLISGKIIKL